MKYKKIPRNLIKQWFVDKLQIDLDSEKLEDICSQIDNETKINYNRCCTDLGEKHDFRYICENQNCLEKKCKKCGELS